MSLPSLHSGHWDPFFAACEETETVVCLHVGSSGTTPTTAPDAPPVTVGVLFFGYAMFAAVDWLYSKVPVRFPRLKICLSEGGIGWVAGLIDRIDHIHRHGDEIFDDTWRGIEPSPSDVLRRNFWFCAIDDESSYANRHVIGVENILVESDYPHSDSTWPDTQSLLRRHLAAVPIARTTPDLLAERGLALSPPSTGEPAPMKDAHGFARQLFAGLPRRYDLLAELLSFGQNRRWRRAMVDHALAGAPSLVLDVATGTAGVALQLVQRSPARVIGIDLSEPMLRFGTSKIDRAHLDGRIDMVVGSAVELPFADASFDALTFTYLLRYVDDAGATLRELARVVKPGGNIASLEFFVPPNRFWRGWWWLYTRLVLPVAGGLAGRAWWRVGRFLGPSISNHYRHQPLPATVDAWHRAGIDDIGVRLMSLGGGLVMWGRTRGG